MSGLEISSILIGIICGNLGAVIVKPFNLGLFWNSILGAIGAGGFVFAQRYFGINIFNAWSYDILAASSAAMGLMLLAGGLTALAYRN